MEITRNQMVLLIEYNLGMQLETFKENSGLMTRKDGKKFSPSNLCHRGRKKICLAQSRTGLVSLRLCPLSASPVLDWSVTV